MTATGWLVPYERLTPGQQQAVDAPVDRHRLIVGAPGSGKTLVLVHRAARLRHRFGSSEDRFCILVFTNVLKAYIRAGLRTLSLPEDSVKTYDAWVRDYHLREIDAHVPRAGHAPDFREIRRRVHDHAITFRPQLLDFVLVDEGQDLDTQAFETLCAVARHVTVAADRKQQIYDDGASEEAIARALGLKGFNQSLLEAHRCSPFLLPLACAFLDDASERTAFEANTKIIPGARTTPVLYRAEDADDERQALGDVLRQRMREGERIAVLFPQQRQVFGFATGLQEEFGLDVQTQGGRGQELPDFSSTKPVLLTYHSAKGLTFDTVFLPRLVEASFGSTSEAARLRRMFVAITRAAKWVWMSTVRGREPGFLARLEPLVRAGQLVERRKRAVEPAHRREGRAPFAPPGDDAFDEILS
ncbi:MAG: UvrD-helicase domain-containing protein [Thermaurantiacus sp.]|uniref:UvrD-helicase domain-containing protein n=1 Tax=Thermaurantiacus sp. TaxID=2820283 RepID=UPI00298F2F7C|nr:UvrD-helicase domain-containing protein [Thermaurantiacus sp.]MDW8414658.1 UvrD-helicase domain-containing protein [Thermaurantiacus sp.]